MNLTRLIEVLHFVRDQINEKELILHYENLKNLLIELDKEPENKSIISNINSEKQIILDFHEDFILRTWAESQNDVIEKLNRERIIGKPAIKKLNYIFTKFRNNPVEASNQIRQIIVVLKIALKEIAILLKSLEPIIEESSRNEVNDEFEEDNLLIITFEDNTFFQNIHLLEKFCRIWSRILMSFMFLSKDSVEPPSIYEIRTNSISFILNNKTVETITQGAYQVLKGYKKVIEIRRLQLEIESINLSNKAEIKNLLDDEVINIVDIISSQVTYELISKFEWDKTNEKEDLYKNIQISLKQIVNFIEKGGRVESKHSKELHSLNEKIIIILKSIKELEKNNNYSKSKAYSFDFNFDDEDEEVERFE
jgi:hypothetical protein